MSLIEIQNTNLHKRVVHLIKKYPSPKEIFELITSKDFPYKAAESYPILPVRDRAMMALYFLSAGRGAEVVGGHRWQRSLTEIKNSDGKFLCVVCKNLLAGNQRKFCSDICRKEVHTKLPPKRMEIEHPGLLAENLVISTEYIVVGSMETVKRSQSVIDKYGKEAILRPDYMLPLELGLKDNIYYDQLVPFSYLVLEYLTKFAPKTGRMFEINAPSAYYIVRYITGNFLNWFRAMGKQFYGMYLFKRNASELASFVNDKDLNTEREYTKYDWRADLKDPTMAMDFKWIQPTIDNIKNRL